MIRTTVLLLLALITVSLVYARSGSEETQRMPLVIVNRTGATILGPLYMHLLVYSDGHVSFVSRSSANDTAHDLDTVVSKDAAAKFHADLLAAKAGELVRSTVQASDLPLTTVTVLQRDARNPGKASANTFDYQEASGAYAAIEARIEAFTAGLVRSAAAGARPGGDPEEQ